MCTAFVKKGNDTIYGFNMDINPEAFDWKLLMNEQEFAVTLQLPEELPDYGVEKDKIPFEYTESDHGVLRLHGVNRNGSFGNQLNNMHYSKAAFEIGENCVPLYHLIDSFIRGRYSMDDLERYARTKKIVNLPAGSIGIPDMGMHSLLSDAQGRIMVLEPGNGYSFVSEKYAVMSNFAVMELPADFDQENFGYYGKDRYDTALSILRNSDDDFSVQDGLDLLDKVKQVGMWGTRVSFVYSRNENAVYYTTEHDFEHIRKHCF